MQVDRVLSGFGHRVLFASMCVVGALATPTAAVAQTTSAAVLDEAAPPGNNYDKAEFRLWFPREAGSLRGVIVLNPGSNGDARREVEDTVWQAFATRHKLALVGTRFTDKKHDQGFIEEYVNMSQGSGQALLDALTRFGTRSQHPEIGTAPLFLWGMSAGGQINYELVAWKPERVAAFVVNKGGIYYTALTSRETRNTPGMLFTGGKDLDQRIQTITGLFAVNRRGGALWALAEEPGVGHVVGRSRDVSMVFFEDVMALRLDERGPLKALSERSGFWGDPKTKEFQPVGEKAPAYPVAWLPTERVALAWRAMVLGSTP